MFVTIVMSGENKKKVYVKVIGNHLQFAMLELQQKKKKSLKTTLCQSKWI